VQALLLFLTVLLVHWCIFLATDTYAESDYHNETAVRLKKRHFRFLENLEIKNKSIVQINQKMEPTTETKPMLNTSKAHTDLRSCMLLEGEDVKNAKSVNGERQGGFNNQRQSMVLSWVIAYLTKHGLILNSILPSAHDPKGYEITDVWDMGTLTKYVPVYPPFPIQGKQFIIEERWGFESAKDIETLSCHPNIYRNSYWGNLFDVFPFMHDEPEVFDRMMESFQYNAQVTGAVDFAKSKMGERYYGIHWRLGDSPRYPMFRCEDHNMTVNQEGKKPENGPDMYIHGVCKTPFGPAGMPSVFRFLLTDESLPIYIASNVPDHVHKYFNSHADLRNRRIYTFRNIFSNTRLNNVQVIAVEHSILAHAVRFVPAIHSSFSEWVIFLRHVNGNDSQDGNFDLWMKREKDFMQGQYFPFKPKILLG